MTIFLIVLAIMLLLVGVAGTIFPVIPALPLMLGGAWLLAYAQNYTVMASGSLITLVLIAAFDWWLSRYIYGFVWYDFCAVNWCNDWRIHGKTRFVTRQ